MFNGYCLQLRLKLHLPLPLLRLTHSSTTSLSESKPPLGSSSTIITFILLFGRTQPNLTLHSSCSVSVIQHLSRLRLLDVFLDTSPGAAACHRAPSTLRCTNEPQLHQRCVMQRSLSYVCVSFTFPHPLLLSCSFRAHQCHSRAVGWMRFSFKTRSAAL
jgi:hypothetical protein